MQQVYDFRVSSNNIQTKRVVVKQPLLKNGIRILYPSEYHKLLEVIPKHHHRLLIELLLHTGSRYQEIIRLSENKEWFKDDRYIFLPKGSILKEKCRQKERCVLLSIKGRQVVKEYLKMNYKPPVRQSLNFDLYRWMVNVNLDPKGICIKSFRKTLVSWLVATKEDKYLSVLSSIGHNTVTSLTFYLSLPFSQEDKQQISAELYGWGI